MMMQSFTQWLGGSLIHRRYSKFITVMLEVHKGCVTTHHCRASRPR